jgi:energy-coupling factor transporter transmembrane protein EcfT
MHMSNTSSSSSGAGFFSLLTVLFIALKLLDKIDWSWWWVLSPTWIPIVIIILIIIGMFLFMTKDPRFNKRWR